MKAVFYRSEKRTDAANWDAESIPSKHLAFASHATRYDLLAEEDAFERILQVAYRHYTAEAAHSERSSSRMNRSDAAA